MIPLLPFSLYLHTLRYLKPSQILGRICKILPRPAVSRGGLPALRQQGAVWRQPALRSASLLGPARFRFLNEEGEVRDATGWNDPQREKLWLYHLHYFDDLIAEGAAGRHEWHKALIRRWVAENPPGFGNGWEPYPLARRIVNWAKWAWAGNELPAGAAACLALQARWLRRHLEWHLLGNHLLADAKGLIFAGLFFAGPEAEEWLAKGLSILECQISEQILADGGHFERSPMYHAQVLEDVLDVVNALRNLPDPNSAKRAAVTEICSEAVPRMLAWLRTMTHPDGGIALFNDAAFGGAATPARLAAYAAALLPGHESAAAVHTGGNWGNVPHFSHLAATGYIRVDYGDMTAFLDVAPIGPDYLPGHAHADTLSFELSSGTQRVLVDSGVSRYGEGAERLRQRGTAAHNTVEIDGQNSSEVWGGFRVARRAYPRDLVVREAEGVVSCAHDGYRRLAGRPLHRREWRFRECGMEIRDRVEGGFREAAGRLHFHPELQVIPSGSLNEGELLLPDGRRMLWRILKGEGRLLNTTWHPEFGKVIPNQCLEIRFDGPETLVELSWK